jgi:hypothetical protein
MAVETEKEAAVDMVVAVMTGTIGTTEMMITVMEAAEMVLIGR